MKALVYQREGHIELADVPEPTPGPNEVVVEVRAAGICGSDVHSVRDGGLLRRPPIVMGHEFSGVTEGRRVAVNPMVSCGSCDFCAEGHDQLCRARSIVGIHRPGGFAERVAVPRSTLVDLPATLSFEAAAMVEPLAVALHAIRLHPPSAGTRVGIIGAGNIGLAAAALCSSETRSVYVADFDAPRRRRAEKLGASRTGERLEGEFDLIVDAAGSPGSHRASVAHLRPAGTAVWIGNESSEAHFDAQDLVRTEKRILGSAAYTRTDFIDAVGKAEGLAFDWATSYPLRDAEGIFTTLMSHPAEAPIKVLLCP